MLPIVLQADTSVGLAGASEGLSRRAALLAAAGVRPVALDPRAERLPEGLRLLFVAGLGSKEAQRLTALARAQGVLVNVEDVPGLCDFHVPAVVRRGDLLLTVSTGGKAPGLAKLIREWIERRLGLEWSGHLDAVAQARAAWRDSGLEPPEVSRRTRALVHERELLP